MADKSCPNPNDENFDSDVKSHGMDQAVDNYVANGNEIPKDSKFANTGVSNRGFSHGNEILGDQQEMNHNYKQWDGATPLDEQGTEVEVKTIGTEDSVNAVLGELRGMEVLTEASTGNQIEDDLQNIDKLDAFFDKIFAENELLNTDADKYIGVVNKKSISQAKKYFRENREPKLRKFLQYLQAVRNNQQGKLADLNITEDEKRHFETIEKTIASNDYQKKKGDTLLKGDKNNTQYGRHQVAEKTRVKMIRQHKLREKALSRLPSWMHPAFKALESAIHNIDNSRMVAKYLTGSDKSSLAIIMYKSFYKASGKMVAMQRKMNETMKITDKAWLEKASMFHNKKAHIDEMNTQEFTFYTGTKDKFGNLTNVKPMKVKLTEMEVVSLHMNMREQAGDSTDPRNELMIKNNGIVLSEVNGREIYDKLYLSPDMEQRAEFQKEVQSIIENNEQLSQVVNSMDTALAERYKEINQTYRALAGFELTNIPNYFPALFGESKRYYDKKLQSVQEVSAMYTRVDPVGDKSVRIADAFEVMARHNFATAHYASMAIPVYNNRKMFKSITENIQGELPPKVHKDLKKLFDLWDDTITKHNDPSFLFTSNEKKFQRWFNQGQNNFALSVLGWNIPVMAKQTASYQLAKEVIDSKYLNKAGWGVGGWISGINPSFIMRTLTLENWNNMKNSIIPLEFRADSSNPAYKEIMKYSDILASRFEGYISRELGEAVMGGNFGNETITIKFKGKKVEIRKDRFMEGIKTFDAATILSIWNATKFEALDKGYKEGSPEFYAYVTERCEEIVAKTQPTYDNANRMAIATSDNPFARVFTMFTSATSKIGQLNMEATIDHINNPTKDSRNKLIKRYANTTLGVTFWIGGVNMMWYGGFALLGDDEEKAEEIFSGAYVRDQIIAGMAGQFPIVRDVVSGITTRVDDQHRWKDNMSMPIEDLINTGYDAVGNTLNAVTEGDPEKRAKYWQKAYKNSGDAFFKGTGLPIKAFNAIRIATGNK